TDASQHVWEVFHEGRMPIVRNAPFAKAFDVEWGYRYSSYSEGYNTNTYKLGLEWAPVDDVRLRASYNRAVRAPNLQELFEPQHAGLQPGGGLVAQGHPLSEAQWGLPGLSAKQFALGGAAQSPASQFNGLIGGNPKLRPEVGKTTDVGVVFTPSFLP